MNGCGGKCGVNGFLSNEGCASRAAVRVEQSYAQVLVVAEAVFNFLLQGCGETFGHDGFSRRPGGKRACSVGRRATARLRQERAGPRPLSSSAAAAGRGGRAKKTSQSLCPHQTPPL